MATHAAADVVDIGLALGYVDGDRELLAELVNVFVEDCPARREALREAVAADDPSAIARAAHALKGSLRMLGAERAAFLADRLESRGREGRTDGAALVLDAFEGEIDAAVGALEEWAGGSR